MLIALAISFLGTNGPAYYLLHRHRLERQFTISQHVAIDKTSVALFAAGHFIGGMAYLYFAYYFYYVQESLAGIFYILVLGMVFEQAQAFIPNFSGWREKVHTVSALMMSLLMFTALVLSVVYIDLSRLAFVGYVIGLVIIVCNGLYGFTHLATMYRSQMFFFSFFYVFMLLLYWGQV